MCGMARHVPLVVESGPGDLIQMLRDRHKHPVGRVVAGRQAANRGAENTTMSQVQRPGWQRRRDAGGGGGGAAHAGAADVMTWGATSAIVVRMSSLDARLPHKVGDQPRGSVRIIHPPAGALKDALRVQGMLMPNTLRCHVLLGTGGGGGDATAATVPSLLPGPDSAQ
jgi:hypothetical protein